uniref:Uncharacterized protein n=1 Tax=Vitis vinifera TaxID=29760 RepID=F6I244_VITVI
MRSRVCFDAVHSDRLRLLIEYGMLTGLHYFGGYRGAWLGTIGTHPLFCLVEFICMPNTN